MLKRLSFIKKIAIPIVFMLGVISVYIYEFSPKKITANTPLVNFRIATSQSPLSAPLIIANHLNLFAKNGLTVTLVPCLGGVKCINRLFNAEADFATSSESVAMFDSFKRSDFSIVTTFVDSDNDMKLLTTSDNKINNISDLTGKKVGVVKASASEFYLYSLLLVNGVDPKTVTKVYVEPKELPHKLYSGEVAAISVWEPYGYLTKMQLGKSTVSNLGITGIYHLTFNLISMNSYLQSNKNNVLLILQSLSEAIEWINQNPEEAMKIVSNNLAIDEQLLDWIWKDYSFRLSLNNSLLSNLQMQAYWAKESGLVSGEIPDYRNFMASNIMDKYMRGVE